MENILATRERQFEEKFAHDEAIKCRIRSRRDSLFAAWMVDQMGEAAPPDYAESFVEFAPGHSSAEFIAKAWQDLHNHGIAMADTKLRKAFEQFDDRAQADIMH
jgi:hypothetical protein